MASTVTVKLFAAFRDALGSSEETIEVSTDDTVADLFDRVLGGHIDSGLKRATLFAVNEAYVPGDTKLKNGDRVAFIPPVSGG